MTRTDNRVLDAFTAVCPYGYTAAKTYIINMHEEMNIKTPGSFKEYAFYHSWDNKVLQRVGLHGFHMINGSFELVTPSTTCSKMQALAM